jgi:hypothetical protein
MLQVTLYTSLKLRGRTTELPRSDFNRLVIRFTRHTLQVFNLTVCIKLKTRLKAVMFYKKANQRIQHRRGAPTGIC